MRAQTLERLSGARTFDTSTLPPPVTSAGTRRSPSEVLTRSFGWLLVGTYAGSQLDLAELKPEFDRFGVRPVLTEEERALLRDAVDAATETRLSYRIYAGTTGMWTLGLVEQLRDEEFPDKIAGSFICGESHAARLQQVRERPTNELLAELDLLRVRLTLGGEHVRYIGRLALGAMAHALEWTLGLSDP